MIEVLWADTLPSVMEMAGYPDGLAEWVLEQVGREAFEAKYAELRAEDPAVIRDWMDR